MTGSEANTLLPPAITATLPVRSSISSKEGLCARRRSAMPPNFLAKSVYMVSFGVLIIADMVLQYLSTLRYDSTSSII